MMKLQNQIFFGITTMMMVINSVTCLQCYTCSTDAAQGEYCKDPFVKDKLTPQQINWTTTNCKPQGYAYGGYHLRPVCKKLVQEVHGKQVIKRLCFFQDPNEPNDLCEKDPTPPYIKTKFCETCDTDFCNSAYSLHVSAYTLILLPVAIFKFLLM